MSLVRSLISSCVACCSISWPATASRVMVLPPQTVRAVPISCSSFPSTFTPPWRRASKYASSCSGRIGAASGVFSTSLAAPSPAAGSSAGAAATEPLDSVTVSDAVSVAVVLAEADVVVDADGVAVTSSLFTVVPPHAASPMPAAARVVATSVFRIRLVLPLANLTEDLVDASVLEGDGHSSGGDFLHV